MGQVENPIPPITITNDGRGTYTYEQIRERKIITASRCLMIALFLGVSITTSAMFIKLQTITTWPLEDSVDEEQFRAKKRKLSIHRKKKKSLAERFESELKHFVDKPRFDVVIPWVNMSDSSWISGNEGHSVKTPLFNPDHADLCQDAFLELKYGLRSYVQYSLMDYVDNFFLVHSDLHSPPCYLEETPKLHFVKHSDMWAPNAKKGLPNFNRNAIEANFHRISGLSTWYLVLNDDYMLMDTFELNDFVGNEGTTQHLGGYYPANWSSSGDGYYGAMAHSAHLLEARFGKRQRNGESHLPYMVWRPAVEEMEATWPDEFLKTSETQEQAKTDIHPSTLYQNYMIDAKLGFLGTMGVGNVTHDPHELHTNAEGFCPPPCDGYEHDVSEEGIENVQKWLARASAKEWRWINVQGPGFDDGYRFEQNSSSREYSPKIKSIARRWFEEMFPEPSPFELSDVPDFVNILTA